MIIEVFNIDSKYYKEMLDIIISAKVNPPEKGYIHHIIPRCWFKHFHKDVDNSISNTVLLSWEDHRQVHKLAYKCAKESWLKSKLACAARLMGDKECNYKHDDITKKKISDSHKGKKPYWIIGRKEDPEHIKERMEKIKLSHTNEWHENHSRIMKLVKHTSEWNKNIGDANRGKRKTITEAVIAAHNAMKGKTWKKINGKRVWMEK